MVVSEHRGVRPQHNTATVAADRAARASRFVTVCLGLGRSMATPAEFTVNYRTGHRSSATAKRYSLWGACWWLPLIHVVPFLAARFSLGFAAGGWHLYGHAGLPRNYLEENIE